MLCCAILWYGGLVVKPMKGFPSGIFGKWEAFLINETPVHFLSELN